MTVIGCLYIAAGAIGFAFHFFAGFWKQAGVPYGALGIEFVRLLAIAAGLFLLRGHNWARWLAVAWMGFHVVVSAFHSLPQLAIHCLFLAVIAWFLFRPEAARYFRGGSTDEHGYGNRSGG